MKKHFIPQTLLALAVGAFGLMSSVAQAHDAYDDRPVPARYHGDRYDHDHDRGYGRDAARQSHQFVREIEARQDRQMARIQDGKRSGELTRHEFRELMDTQREIRAMKTHFLADGILDSREYRRLDRALDRASQSIRAEKHDHQARNQRGGQGPWYN